MPLIERFIYPIDNLSIGEKMEKKEKGKEKKEVVITYKELVTKILTGGKRPAIKLVGKFYVSEGNIIFPALLRSEKGELSVMLSFSRSTVLLPVILLNCSLGWCVPISRTSRTGREYVTWIPATSAEKVEEEAEDELKDIL